MKTWFAILSTGLVVGLIDGLAASLHANITSGVGSNRVARFIASGVFGEKAFRGGPSMVVLGALFHWIIALCWTALFFFIATHVRLVGRHLLLSGFLYGFVIWAVMTYAVVPLSQTPMRQEPVGSSLVMLGIHLFLVGMPMGFMTGRFGSFK